MRALEVPTVVSRGTATAEGTTSFDAGACVVADGAAGTDVTPDDVDLGVGSVIGADAATGVAACFDLEDVAPTDKDATFEPPPDRPAFLSGPAELYPNENQ